MERHVHQDRPASPAGLRLVTGLLLAASSAYLAAGLLWSRTRAGFPFGPDGDPIGKHQSLLEDVRHDDAWPWVVGLALLGIATTLGMRCGPASRARTRLVVGLAVLQGVAYAVVVPDGRPLIAAAHVPILLAGKPFGWPDGVTVASQVPWPVVHQMVLMALGTLWLAAAAGFSRVSRDACMRCGRTDVVARWTEPDSARTWGRWAVFAAMATPVFYASTRLSWAFGVPFGVSDDFLTDMEADEPDIFVAGALIATMALGGAVLTYGLVARWGERWPFWVPRLHGRPVRPFVAIVPGAVVSVLMVSAGVGWYHAALAGYLPEGALDDDWGTVAFGALLPLWGVALAFATYAYWLRRRTTCRSCGRGSTGSPVTTEEQPIHRTAPAR